MEEELDMTKYMGDASYWNSKFENRNMVLFSPEKLLLDDAEYFQFGGLGLELACGDGRNIIPFAKMGYTMTGVDFSEIALERLKHFSKEHKVSVDTVLMDLTDIVGLDVLPEFDFIVINHYRLRPEFYIKIMEHLKTGGYLWVNGFVRLPSNHSDITESDLLREEDFESIHNTLVDRREYENEHRKFVRYCFRK